MSYELTPCCLCKAKKKYKATVESYLMHAPTNEQGKVMLVENWENNSQVVSRFIVGWVRLVNCFSSFYDNLFNIPQITSTLWMFIRRLRMRCAFKTSSSWSPKMTFSRMRDGITEIILSTEMVSSIAYSRILTRDSS